ncbi:hypothetical protein L202_02932 [Cryptococcus amylolentus CBS 6039]|uniref:Uncharacterized protein n=1 Tax=Cryptococcus amylolentus CBS 6039 TaxID=1295533 RepID=A0A1E3HYY8_9TREE|nr:hypothetical protein L202_02932 [Cryptococcus amylolentus CBS 6039]ODN80781.1 hypothetical protein L202_02932 [Cryptococcus amylolentus CBS 6039]
MPSVNNDLPQSAQPSPFLSGGVAPPSSPASHCSVDLPLVACLDDLDGHLAEKQKNPKSPVEEVTRLCDAVIALLVHLNKQCQTLLAVDGADETEEPFPGKISKIEAAKKEHLLKIHDKAYTERAIWALKVLYSNLSDVSADLQAKIDADIASAAAHNEEREILEDRLYTDIALWKEIKATARDSLPGAVTLTQAEVDSSEMTAADLEAFNKACYLTRTTVMMAAKDILQVLEEDEERGASSSSSTLRQKGSGSGSSR